MGRAWGQISPAVCVWVREADELSPHGNRRVRFITKGKVLYLKEGKVGQTGKTSTVLCC